MSNEFLIKGVNIAKLPSDYGSTGFKMFKGSILNNVEIAYETWGDLSINKDNVILLFTGCLLYTSPSPRDRQKTRMPSSA